MKPLGGDKLGIYLHIPFCARKCNYCDFCSITGTDEGQQLAYVQELCREIESYESENERGRGGSNRCGGDLEETDINRYYVDSIFIGGGTPSILPAAFIERILGKLAGVFHIEKNAEITIEANPGTLKREKLAAYRSMGINRLSMGVQSLDDDLLKLLGRIHDGKTALENYAQARAVGFENINLDLMLGIPGQTFEVWESTLTKALELSPEHLSFYSLQIEEGTPFYRQIAAGELFQLPEELDRAMYHRTLAALSEKGYRHYEISNAAKEGFSCRHNLKYWSMEDYLGMGLAAHSYIKGLRFFNPSDMQMYLDGKRPEEARKNDRKDSISDYLFTGLRLIRGIDLTDFERRYGEAFSHMFPKELARFTGEGLLEVEGNRLRYTKKGLDFTNTVLRSLMQGGGSHE